MPRYPLIMKDRTYVALLQEAARRKTSLGRYLNIILNEKAEQILQGGEPVMPEKCCVCGRIPVKYVAWKDGLSTYYCKFHKPDLNKVDGYKEVEQK